MYHCIINFFILASLFLTEETHFKSHQMVFSDAMPVQFWMVNCLTYNEKQNDGVHYRCFCQPWQCDDEIVIQFTDDPSRNFALLVYEDDTLKETLSFEEIALGVYQLTFTPSAEDSPEYCDSFIQLKIQENATQESVTPPDLADFLTTTGTPPTLAALSAWINATGANPGTWNLDADPDVSVNGNGGVSGYICGAIDTNAGFDYEFDVQFEIFGAGAGIDINVTFALLDASFNELDTILFNYTSIGVKTPNFTLNGGSDGTYLAMRITNDTPVDSKSFEIQSATYTPGVTTPEWTLGANPSLDTVFDGTTSENLYVDFAFTIGEEYSITVEFTNTASVGGLFNVSVTDASFNVQFTESKSGASVGSNSSDTLTFVATADTTRISISLTFFGATNTTTITGITLTRSIGSSEIIAKSDCLDIRTEHPETVYASYSYHRNYAGLFYADISPAVSFNIRIPAIFFHERFPEEDETILLTDQVVTLTGTMRKQRLLDTNYLPYYFHEKIMLILKQNVEIFDYTWVKQEGYEILEGDRRSPMKKAKVWLSRQDFVQRNTL